MKGWNLADRRCRAWCLAAKSASSLLDPRNFILRPYPPKLGAVKLTFCEIRHCCSLARPRGIGVPRGTRFDLEACVLPAFLACGGQVRGLEGPDWRVKGLETQECHAVTAQREGAVMAETEKEARAPGSRQCNPLCVALWIRIRLGREGRDNGA